MQLTLASFDTIARVTGLEHLPLRRIIQKYLDAFVSDADGSSTLRCKVSDFSQLLLFLGNGDVDKPVLADLTKRRVEDFRAHRIEQGDAFSTVNRRLKTIKVFSRELSQRLPDYHDTIRDVATFEIPSPETKALTAEEWHRIRNLPRMGQSLFSDVRNRTLIELMGATALRADEILSIDVAHLDWPWLRQLKTKGRKIRNVYVATPLEGLVAKYLHIREQEINRRAPGHMYLSTAEKKKFPLWLTFYKANINEPETFRMSYETLRNTVYQIGQAAGVEGLHPHRFRHDALTALRRAGHDLAVIQRAAGHSDIRTTQLYYVASDDEVAAALEKRAANI